MYIAGCNGIGALTQQGADILKQGIETSGDIITSIWGNNDASNSQQQQTGQNTSQDLYNQLLLQQYLQNQQNAQNQKQDNTLLYVLLGLGVGVLLISMTNKK